MRIWIDLANSPHVLFFAPIVRDLAETGDETLITTREFAQTVGLARLHGLEHVLVGAHGGRAWRGKASNLWGRARQLAVVARAFRPDLAVSHNSYSAILAARFLRVPALTFMDYEHTPANHLAFRLAHTVAVPEAVPLTAIRKYGAHRRKVRTYPGFKEQLYLEGFQPVAGALEPELSDAECAERVLVVARPPADFAVYHRFAHPFFEQWLETVGRRPDCLVLALPRTAEQAGRIRALGLPSVRVPARALPGPDLLSRADLVVSAGGTMNREAAVLGVPAYSAFAGEPPAVDRELARLGRLRLLRGGADLAAVPVVKKATPVPLSGGAVRRSVLDLVRQPSPKNTNSLVLGST